VTNNEQLLLVECRALCWPASTLHVPRYTLHRLRYSPSSLAHRIRFLPHSLL